MCHSCRCFGEMEWLRRARERTHEAGATAVPKPAQVRFAWNARPRTMAASSAGSPVVDIRVDTREQRWLRDPQGCAHRWTTAATKG